MPVNDNLPDHWYLTPNAHLCTIRDFADLCERIDAEVEQAVAFNASGARLPIKWSLSHAESVRRKRPCFFCAAPLKGCGATCGLLPAGADPGRIPRVHGLQYGGSSDPLAAADWRHDLFPRLDQDDARDADRHARSEAFDRGRHAQQQSLVVRAENRALRPSRRA